MILSELAQNAAANAVTALLDGGALVLLDAAHELVQLPLSVPAFGPALAGLARIAAPLENTATGDGMATGFEARAADGAIVQAGLVGLRGTKRPDGRPWDLELDNDSIRAGQTVRIADWTYAQPAQPAGDA